MLLVDPAASRTAVPCARPAHLWGPTWGRARRYTRGLLPPLLSGNGLPVLDRFHTALHDFLASGDLLPGRLRAALRRPGPFLQHLDQSAARQADLERRAQGLAPLHAVAVGLPPLARHHRRRRQRP